MSTKSKEKKQALFCPGPVNVAKNVKDAAVNNEIGHREPEFSVLLESINKKVLKLFMIKKVKEYQPLIISGSGTAANEAIFFFCCWGAKCISNF
jgi:aspartate aminotransferase-like enzyme